MVTKVYETLIDAPVQQVWDFHSSANALRLLTPPEDHIELISRNLEVREGATHEYRLKKFGRRHLWRARISDVKPPYTFTDTAEHSPFAYWKHVHEFIEDPQGTLVKDTVTYKASGWLFSGLVNALVVEEAVDRLFKYRHMSTHEFIENAQRATINDDLIGRSADHYEPHVT